jgi:hypothetical protein
MNQAGPVKLWHTGIFGGYPDSRRWQRPAFQLSPLPAAPGLRYTSAMHSARHYFWQYFFVPPDKAEGLGVR